MHPGALKQMQQLALDALSKLEVGPNKHIDILKLLRAIDPRFTTPGPVLFIVEQLG